MIKELNMLRKMGLLIVGTLGLFSHYACATTEHFINNATMSYEFVLPPNDPQIFTNTWFWTLEAKCTIISKQENMPFSFTMLRKNGTLNGVALVKGDAMDMIVNHGDVLHITAASGGRVELVNRGEETIKASCTSAK